MTGLEVVSLLSLVVSTAKDARQHLADLKHLFRGRASRKAESAAFETLRAEVDDLVEKTEELAGALEQLALITKALAEWSVQPWWKRAFSKPSSTCPAPTSRLFPASDQMRIARNETPKFGLIRRTPCPNLSE
ncbi:MAG: hypothetical protein ABL949_13795 [Fimbriimonadaceae bacterium]